LNEQTLVAEKKLEELLIPKKYRVGAEFYYCPSGPWAKSYKYGQGATSLRIVRLSKFWAIKSIERRMVYPLQKEMKRLSLNEHQRNIALTKFCSRFNTIKTDNGALLENM